MGYYADLINEKQNAKPFYTPEGKELKKRAEVERYMLEQRRKVDERIRWMEAAKKRIQDIEREPKPHTIDWADRYHKAKDSYISYKRAMEMYEEYSEKARDWLSENHDAYNSKEEKENAIPSGKRIEFEDDIVAVYNPQGKVIYKGLEDDDPHKRDDWRWDGSKGYYTNPAHPGFVKVCFRNEKEEKDNASVQDRFRYKGCMITILKKGENQYTFSVEQNGHEEGSNKVYPSQDKAEAEAKREVETNWNEKEEEKGYYAKLAEEKAAKKNASSSFRFHGRTFQYDTNRIDSVISAARKIEDYKDDLGDEPSVQREYNAVQREIAFARDKAEKAESKYRISGEDIHEWRI